MDKRIINQKEIKILFLNILLENNQLVKFLRIIQKSNS